jgi:hypothetical protein
MMKIENKHLCYYGIMHNGVLFRDFWRPVMKKEECYKTRYYQYPEALSGGLTMVAGRGIGKSIGLEMWIAMQMVTRRMCEGLLTSFRSLHTRDRMESVITFFYAIPYFRHFLRDKNPVRRQPTYEVNLKSGVVMYGIAIGDDPQAVNMTGKHAKFRAIEEAQFYPSFAFTQFQGTAHPSGTVDRAIGVPNGMVNSTLKLLDKGVNRLHVPKIFDPDLTTAKKDALFDSYGGSSANDTTHQFWGMWGEPISSAWDLDTIRSCMITDKSNPAYVAWVEEIERENFSKGQENADLFLHNLPDVEGEAQKILICMDVGHSAKSAILVFIDYGKRFRQIARVMLAGRWNHLQQSKVLDYIFSKYNIVKPTYVAVDCTSGEGRALADELTNSEKNINASAYKRQLYRVQFNSSEVVRREIDERGKEREIKEGLKDLTARILRGLFVQYVARQRAIILPYDTEILEDFGREYRHRDEKTGKTTLGTPDDVHIPEAMRCFAYLVWLFYVKEEPETGEVSQFVFPVALRTPITLSAGAKYVN